MHKRWIIKTLSSSNQANSLASSINVSLPIASILVKRGIVDFDTAKNFFRPDLSQLHDPMLMKDMDKAVNRILKAMQLRQKILFFGDYDVDGTTAVAMMVSFFRDELKYDAIGYYVPDRYTEGYGVSFQGIDYAVQHGFHLIVSLDCGIKSYDKVAYAAEKGIDFIICDHHLPDENPPKALAILNPKQPGCEYPYKELSGCGVGFKLLQALSNRIQLEKHRIFSYLDLVAVSTCSDIVPLTGENRILVYHGLQLINSKPRPGIEAIRKFASLERDFTVEDVVFIIGPRINAAGRIQHGEGAVKLLLSLPGDAEIPHMLQQLNDNNTTRRQLDKQITEQALLMIQENEYFQKSSSHVLFHPEWHKGVVGIVASRVIEHYYKPTIILTESNGKATGSARSVKGFDVHAAIEACADLLENFGGHMHAAGVTLPLENVESFRQRFDQVVNETWPAELRIPEIEIDEEITLEQITPNFFKVISQFAPFGPENMDPVFLIRNLVANHWTRVVGENHLRMYVCHPNRSDLTFGAIAFKQAQHYQRIASGAEFHIVCNLRQNVWNGKTSIELDVKDIRFDDLSDLRYKNISV
jgi:single-stranded-DNA-specific exonuclease